jgi:diguanylate cyclase (GGDEF)-like protein
MAVSGKILPADQMRLFEHPIVLNDQTIGQLQLGLETASALQKLEDQKYRLLKWELLVIFVTLIGEFIALSFLIIRPVRKITGTFEGISKPGPTRMTEIDLPSRDEFGVMARQFNGMSQRLSEAHARLQSKIDIADQQLMEKNRQLIRQQDELQRVNRELWELSITDNLTGLYNRRHFDEHFRKAVAMARRYGHRTSLLLIDLDHFKDVNDTYGHAAGDEVLKKIADVLKRGTRDSDIPCRLGGEEFAVLCTMTAAPNAVQLAEKIRNLIARAEVSVDNTTVSVTASLGVSTMPDRSNGFDEKTFMECADLALYWSKNHGRNQVKHCNEIDQDNRGDGQNMSV